MCRNVTIFEKVERGNSMMERRRNNYLPSMKHYLEMIKVKKKEKYCDRYTCVHTRRTNLYYFVLNYFYSIFTLYYV